MKYLLIFILFFTQACHKNSYPTFDYNRSTHPWIDAFKDRVFFSALEEAYKSDSSIFRLIRNKDAFNPYDGFYGEARNTAREIGINIIKKMPPPAICEGCKDDMNYYMATALHYYKSKELDLLAKKYYKIQLNKDKLSK